MYGQVSPTKLFSIVFLSRFNHLSSPGDRRKRPELFLGTSIFRESAAD